MQMCGARVMPAGCHVRGGARPLKVEESTPPLSRILDPVRRTSVEGMETSDGGYTGWVQIPSVHLLEAEKGSGAAVAVSPRVHR
ncbi:Uu.00g019220.m01.CDS01 [Anthostomella pinea]|uniref:Uu.00g019220.m01.CDS01 n=1 Tax=Anthostomella pinea TaxID=933095 RepID=A0AAI8YQN7_9PEZI|nr:Uu.00g019220.m01.CDS01 [Anthostomella pinea]